MIQSKWILFFIAAYIICLILTVSYNQQSGDEWMVNPDISVGSSTTTGTEDINALMNPFSAIHNVGDFVLSIPKIVGTYLPNVVKIATLHADFFDASPYTQMLYYFIVAPLAACGLLSIGYAIFLLFTGMG